MKAFYIALLLAGCAAFPAFGAEVAPKAAPCPEGVVAHAKCLRGRDSAGGHYLIVVPEKWNGVLVVHAHGGPSLEPRRARVDEDAKRWAIVGRAGYAWAASAFSKGGVAVRSAAEDSDRVRRIFVEHVAVPKRTIMHGQSWGGSVAAKAAEMYAAPGDKRPAFDGVLMSSAMDAGGSRSYDFRLDLRVVYQYLCGNHPKPDEAKYPLWMGLPSDGKLTRAELAARVDDCLGLRKPPAQRSAEQASKLKTIVDVIKIPEQSVLAHLNWATWHFRDIIQNRTGGLNPFGNEGVRYAGSADDAALNSGVARYKADPDAIARFSADTDMTGRIGIPVLTVHATGDPTAFVELESTFRSTMEKGGSGSRLVQAFTSDQEHSYLADPVYPALFAALLKWIETGEKPTPAGIAASCKPFEAQFGPGCRFLPDYQPAPLEARVPTRTKISGGRP